MTLLPPGDVRPATSPEGDEIVLFCTASGRVGAIGRICPHLDWDLADAEVVGEELVCPGHGWSFTTDGRACKRNERGRADDKGTIAAWAVEVDGTAVRVGPRVEP